MRRFSTEIPKEGAYCFKPDRCYFVTVAVVAGRAL
jgi:hypothetical protein